MIYKIYRDYIKEHKMYVLISIVVSLRLEPFSYFITLLGIMLITNILDSSIFLCLGYQIIISIVPIILSYLNLRKMTPYIEKYCIYEYVKVCKWKIFIINFMFFSLTVTFLVTILGEKVAPLITFDVVRMSFLYLR